MVSKRQQIARKRYKEANPELFPPPPPPDPNKKKKKKSSFKRKSSDPSNPNKIRKSSGKKHPLRVAGMKPGESCYICKAPDHIAKKCPNKSDWERNKVPSVCLVGNEASLKNCPNQNEESTDRKLCYNCGQMGHSLAHCSQPLQDGGTKYANCFICNETGHLSKDCPKNTHGIYPKGGSCKTCGGVTHLARDCPSKRISSIHDAAGTAGQSSYLRPNRVTKFSGDDLEDDFVSVVPLAGKDEDVKTKKMQGTKVVNFVG